MQIEKILISLASQLSFKRVSSKLVFLIFSTFLLSQFAAASAPARKKPLDQLPMSFTLVQNGNCDATCVQWISAEGEFTADTPSRLTTLIKSLKGRKLPVVLQSHGGDVYAALAVGRIIRAADLETAVGRTQLDDCPMLEPRCPKQIAVNGWSRGEVHSGGAFCFSACPLALAGGIIRAAAANAEIGLHQLTNGSKSASYSTAARRNLQAISTRRDPFLIRMLTNYFREMGVNDADVFTMMGLATPEGLYYLQSAEALKSGVLTKIYSYDEEPGYLAHGK